MLKKIILIGALASVAYTSTAADEPILPWYENSFFPVGAWSYPYYECVPDSDYYVDPDPKHNSPKADITWSEWNSRFMI